MRFIVFSKKNCPYCVKAKEAIQMRDMKFIEFTIGEDLTRDEFLSLFPNARTVPQIILDQADALRIETITIDEIKDGRYQLFGHGLYIGGHHQLVSFFDGIESFPCGIRDKLDYPDSEITAY